MSCCGCFRGNLNSHSAITYNLISDTDITILLSTVFEATEHHLTSFTKQFDIPRDIERLVNEIAFGKSEEPLIAPRLWHSLSIDQKRNLRLSIRDQRLHIDAPPIICITPEEVAPVTPDVFLRLGLSLQPSGLA